MVENKAVFQIDTADNVATALTQIAQGTQAAIAGDHKLESITASTDIPVGHKIALRDIACGEDIIKYGVVIGRAWKDIPAGSWVHLHVMRSVYDERSSHLDEVTGAPKDTKYE